MTTNINTFSVGTGNFALRRFKQGMSDIIKALKITDPLYAMNNIYNILALKGFNSVLIPTTYSNCTGFYLQNSTTIFNHLKEKTTYILPKLKIFDTLIIDVEDMIRCALKSNSTTAFAESGIALERFLNFTYNQTQASRVIYQFHSEITTQKLAKSLITKRITYFNSIPSVSFIVKDNGNKCNALQSFTQLSNYSYNDVVGLNYGHTDRTLSSHCKIGIEKLPRNISFHLDIWPQISKKGASAKYDNPSIPRENPEALCGLIKKAYHTNFGLAGITWTFRTSHINKKVIPDFPVGTHDIKAYIRYSIEEGMKCHSLIANNLSSSIISISPHCKEAICSQKDHSPLALTVEDRTGSKPSPQNPKENTPLESDSTQPHLSSTVQSNYLFYGTTFIAGIVAFYCCTKNKNPVLVKAMTALVFTCATIAFFYKSTSEPENTHSIQSYIESDVNTLDPQHKNQVTDLSGEAPIETDHDLT